MSADYAEMAVDALEMLAEFGAAVTRRSHTTGTYDPATGSASTTTADTTRTGVFLGINGGAQYVRGQLIQGGDKRLLLDASAAVALQDHFIDGAGGEWTIVSLDPIAPAGVAVLYDIHVRL
jgi:hypothetical protein